MFSQESFSKLYAHFKKPIHRYVRSKVSDENVAEELTQDVFLKVFRFSASYKKEYALSTWLWTIARNTISDHLRGVKAATDADATINEDVAPDELPSPDRSAEALIIEKDERRNLIKVMRALTRLQRRVLWLRLIHQLSYEEISRRLGLSLTAVKNLAYRAKLTLSQNVALAPSFA